MKKLLISDRNNSKSLIVRIANAVFIAAALFAVTSQFAMAQAPHVPAPGTAGFSDIQVDGDRVKILTAAGSPGKIKIKVSADGSWWKMLRVYDKNNRANWIEQEDGLYVNKKDVIEIDSSALNDTFKLEFWKAKLFGVHTHIMNETYRKLDFDGKIITFVWREGLEDEDSDLSEDVRTFINETLTIDGKEVTIKSEDKGKAGSTTIKFRTDVDWWTAIKLFDRNGKEKLIQKDNGSYNPPSGDLTIPISSLPSEVTLEFWTGKLLGVHTHMTSKKLIRERFDGRTITISWGAPAKVIDETVKIDGKTVTIKSSDTGTTGYVTIKFTTSLAWWTAVKFFDKNGKAKQIQKVDGKYNPTTNTLKLPISSFGSNITLEFWTAKAFGVHTHMTSKVITSERFNGRIVTINWPK